MSDLQEQLRLLYEFQQIDTEILTLHHKHRSIPSQIQKLEEQFQIHQQKLQAKQEQLASAEKEQRSHTAQLEMHQAQRGKYQAQLQSVKTNKEYQALDNEIAFLREREAETEDEILSVMLQIDQLKEELDQQQQEFNAAKAKHNKQKAQYEQEAQALKSQITACQEKRRTAYHGISQELMGHYNEWFKRQRTGLISLVVNGVCSSCHLMIPPQTLQEARKNEHPIRCGSCRRILYIPTPPDEASSKEPSPDSSQS